jgi:hypothetical protein
MFHVSRKKYSNLQLLKLTYIFINKFVEESNMNTENLEQHEHRRQRAKEKYAALSDDNEQLGLEVVNINIIVGLNIVLGTIRIIYVFFLVLCWTHFYVFFSCFVLDSLVIMFQLQTTMTNSLIS